MGADLTPEDVNQPAADQSNGQPGADYTWKPKEHRPSCVLVGAYQKMLGILADVSEKADELKWVRVPGGGAYLADKDEYILEVRKSEQLRAGVYQDIYELEINARGGLPIKEVLEGEAAKRVFEVAQRCCSVS